MICFFLIIGFRKDDFDHVHPKRSEYLCLAEQATAILVELVLGEQAVCLHDDVFHGQYD